MLYTYLLLLKGLFWDTPCTLVSFYQLIEYSMLQWDVIDIQQNNFGETWYWNFSNFK